MSFNNYGYSQESLSTGSYSPTVNGINSLNSGFVMQQQQQQHHQHQPPPPQNSLMSGLPVGVQPNNAWAAQNPGHSYGSPQPHPSSPHPGSPFQDPTNSPWPPPGPHQQQQPQQAPQPVHHQHHQHHSVQPLHRPSHSQHGQVRQISQPHISGRMSSLPPPHISSADPGRMPVQMQQHPHTPYQDSDIAVARALLDAQHVGKTYKQALEGLHQFHNKPAYHWKDYYLEHTHRINSLVMRLQDPSTKTLKKPNLEMFAEPKPDPRNGVPRWGSSPGYPHSREGSVSARLPPGMNPGPSGRQTLNSLAGPSAVYTHHMPAPNAEIQIPEAPSRSPTPPTRIESKGGTNYYTSEDKDYFIKFISWRLKEDPNLTRAELCDQLAESAPQHTRSSWNSHWQKQHDIADKILQAAHDRHWNTAATSSTSRGKRTKKKDEDDDDDDSDEEVITRTTKSRRAMKATRKSDSTPPPSPRDARGKINVPGPPSRSPSPPVAPTTRTSGRVTRYTAADDEYLIKFIGWRLKQEPTLNRQEICDQLAKKMPHHTASAWLSHWRRFNDGMPDAIYDAAHIEKEEEDDEEEAQDDDDDDGAASEISSLTEESEISEYKSRARTTRTSSGGRRGRASAPQAVPSPPPSRRRKSKVVEDEDADADGSEDEGGGGGDDAADDYSGTLSEDERDMGEAGGPFTDADQRVAARYISTLPNWGDMTSKARWEGFVVKYPGRSYKSWSEYYRRMENKIDKIARVYKKKQAQASPAQAAPRTPDDQSGSQAAVPPPSSTDASHRSSVAVTSEGRQTPSDGQSATKRKLSDAAEDDDDANESESRTDGGHPQKMPRMDVDEQNA